MKRLALAFMLILSGCHRGLTGAAVDAAVASCGPHGGVRWLSSSGLEGHSYYARCNDGTVIEGIGRVKHAESERD